MNYFYVVFIVNNLVGILCATILVTCSAYLLSNVSFRILDSKPLRNIVSYGKIFREVPLVNARLQENTR